MGVSRRAFSPSLSRMLTVQRDSVLSVQQISLDEYSLTLRGTCRGTPCLTDRQRVGLQTVIYSHCQACLQMTNDMKG